MNASRSYEDEQELLRACVERKTGAWEDFLARYSKLIYYSIHRTCQSRNYRPEPDELEDLYAELLVNLIKDDCKKLRQYRGDRGATVATWIRTITVRFAIDHLRRQARGPERLSVSVEDDLVVAEASWRTPSTSPADELESRDEDEAFVRAVGSLGEKDRYFMQLYYTQGLKPEEVAKVLDISVKTVYTRVNRLKEKLKAEIERQGRNV